MRIIVDECVGDPVADWLVSQGHDVFAVHLVVRGMSDQDILAKAVAEDRLLITNDKDFGERVFRLQEPHRGVICLRLRDERSAPSIRALQAVFGLSIDWQLHPFVVVADGRIRCIYP